MRVTSGAVAFLALLLVPSALAGGAQAPFDIAATESQTLRLRLDKAGDVSFAVHFNAGYARNLVMDGPGACDLTIDASAGVGDSTMGHVKCDLPAGTSALTLGLDVGYVRGYLVASRGLWV